MLRASLTRDSHDGGCAARGGVRVRRSVWAHPPCGSQPLRCGGSRRMQRRAQYRACDVSSARQCPRFGTRVRGRVRGDVACAGGADMCWPHAWPAGRPHTQRHTRTRKLAHPQPAPLWLCLSAVDLAPCLTVPADPHTTHSLRGCRACTPLTPRIVLLGASPASSASS
jgi:hypothetical protein